MVKTSTATGWSALFLAAQVALLPVAASPLNVTPMALLERTHSAGQKRDHRMTMSFYPEVACGGSTFLLMDTGSSPDAGETSCLGLYDPSTGNQKCAKSVAVTPHDTWSGRGFVLSLYENAQCDGATYNQAVTDAVASRLYCMTLSQGVCFNSVRMVFY